MPVALYKKNGKYVEIKAVNVDPKSKKKIAFFCEGCKITVIHSKGNKKEGSKPYFRKAPFEDHDLNCIYSGKSNIKDIVREIGTIENLFYGIKPPLEIQQKEKIQTGKRLIEEEKVKKEHKTTKTRVNENKKSRRNLLTVDDLFYELADIANQEQSIKEKLYKRIIGFIYYPYSKYEMLIEKFQSKILKTYFFTAGKLYKNEFVKLKEYGYAILSGKKSDIKLRIYPFNDDIINKLKTITWETKKSGCYSEYIGIKASMKGISKESTITYIELNAFEIDVDNYRYI